MLHLPLAPLEDEILVDLQSAALCHMCLLADSGDVLQSWHPVD
jgi:hypothetical protein